MSARPVQRRASPVWAVTFADLVTLLIAFFVLLVSMSHLGESDWRAMRDSLMRSFQGIEGFRPGQAAPDAAARRDGDYWAALIAMRARLSPALQGAQVAHRAGETVITLPSAATSSDPRAAAGLLADLGAAVLIEADAGDDPASAFARTRALEAAFGAAVAVEGVYLVRRPGQDRLLVRPRGSATP